MLEPSSFCQASKARRGGTSCNYLPKGVSWMEITNARAPENMTLRRIKELQSCFAARIPKLFSNGLPPGCRKV